VLEVDDALDLLLLEGLGAVQCRGVVAVAVAEDEGDAGALGLRLDALGDRVDDRDRLLVGEVPDGDALAAAGSGLAAVVAACVSLLSESLPQAEAPATKSTSANDAQVFLITAFSSSTQDTSVLRDPSLETIPETRA
jgi:hypothetical protein